MGAAVRSAPAVCDDEFVVAGDCGRFGRPPSCPVPNARGAAELPVGQRNCHPGWSCRPVHGSGGGQTSQYRSRTLWPTPASARHPALRTTAPAAIVASQTLEAARRAPRSARPADLRANVAERSACGASPVTAAPRGPLGGCVATARRIWVAAAMWIMSFIRRFPARERRCRTTSPEDSSWGRCRSRTRTCRGRRRDHRSCPRRPSQRGTP